MLHVKGLTNALSYFFFFFLGNGSRLLDWDFTDIDCDAGNAISSLKSLAVSVRACDDPGAPARRCGDNTRAARPSALELKW